MKNKLSDLNDHLFAQMERLSEEDLTTEDMKHEIQRGHALASVARQIIENGRLALRAQQMADEGVLLNGTPAMLGLDYNPRNGTKRQ